MRCTLLLIVISVWAMTACQSDSNTENTGGDQPPQSSRRAPTPAPSTYEADLLLRDYWVFEYFIAPNDPVTSKENKGKWFKFNADGTFSGGHWQDYKTQGTWTLYYGNQRPVIHLDADDDRLDGEFQIQAVSNNEEYMSWMGTRRYDQKGYAAKVMNLLSEPTRKQFGVE